MKLDLFGWEILEIPDVNARILTKRPPTQNRYLAKNASFAIMEAI